MRAGEEMIVEKWWLNECGRAGDVVSGKMLVTWCVWQGWWCDECENDGVVMSVEELVVIWLWKCGGGMSVEGVVMWWVLKCWCDECECVSVVHGRTAVHTPARVDTQDTACSYGWSLTCHITCHHGTTMSCNMSCHMSYWQWRLSHGKPSLALTWEGC